MLCSSKDKFLEAIDLIVLCLTERVPGWERDPSKISPIPEKHRGTHGHHPQTQRGRWAVKTAQTNTLFLSEGEIETGPFKSNSLIQVK